MLSTINTHASIQALPLDIIEQVVGKPDITKIDAIIKKQQEINRLANIYHPNNDPSIVITVTEQSCFEIQQALFPCFALTQTWRKYQTQNIKKRIADRSKEIVYTIFPQGIVPFLIPKSLQFLTIYENFKQENLLLNQWLEFCYHKESQISKEQIIATLLYTPKCIRTVTQTDAFKNLLTSQALTYSHNPKLKTHTLYDQSETIVMVLTEEKFIIPCAPFFTITNPFPNDRQLQKLLPCLAHLCTNNFKPLSHKNNILYKISKGELISFTPIEFILHELWPSIKFVKKRLDLADEETLDQQRLLAYFSNWFTVIDFLCSLKTTNLSLPAVSQEGNVAKKIVTEFKTKGYPLDIFSQEALANLKFCLDDNNDQDWLLEKKSVIDALVNIYLGYCPN